MGTILTGVNDVTASDIIKSALGEIGVIGIGETLEAEDGEDCLLRLNAMLNTLSGDDLMLYVFTQEQFDLTAGTVSYEIGEGAPLDTTRPERVDKTSFIRDSSGNDRSLQIITKDQYNALSSKTPGNSIPTHLYYDPLFPIGTVYLYPPSDGTHDLFLVSEKAFTEFTDLTSILSFPPGYREMLIYNLAVRLAGPYRKALSQVTISIATSSMRNIQDRNAAQRPIRGSVSVPAGSRGYANPETLRG